MALTAAQSQQQRTLFRATLREEQTTFLEASLAKSTQAKVVTAMRNYAAFCDLLGYEPHLQAGGISNPELELYITWMARTLRPDRHHIPVPVQWDPPPLRGGRDPLDHTLPALLD